MGRGQSVRILQLSRMYFTEMAKEAEGVTPTWAMVLVARESKTNQMGRLEMTGCMRHKEVELCPIGATALYLFYRYHITKEKAPDFFDNRSWYNVQFMKKQDKAGRKRKRTQPGPGSIPFPTPEPSPAPASTLDVNIAGAVLRNGIEVDTSALDDTTEAQAISRNTTQTTGPQPTHVLLLIEFIGWCPGFD